MHNLWKRQEDVTEMQICEVTGPRSHRVEIQTPDFHFASAIQVSRQTYFLRALYSRHLIVVLYMYIYFIFLRSKERVVHLQCLDSSLVSFFYIRITFIALQVFCFPPQSLANYQEFLSKTFYFPCCFFHSTGIRFIWAKCPVLVSFSLF